MLLPMMTTSDLDAFFEQGWNGHNVDRLMTFMADECVFDSASGPEACGGRHVGREAVRRAFARIFEAFPDVRFEDTRHVVAGDRRGGRSGASPGPPPTGGASRWTAAISSRSRSARSRARARS